MIRGLTGAVVLMWIALAGTAFGAPPQILGGTSGVCSDESKEWDATLSESRDHFLLRYTASDGPTRLKVATQQEKWLQGPDVAWFDVNEEISVGGILSGSVACQGIGAGTFAVEMFDIPAAPTTFQGRLTRQVFGTNSIVFRSLGAAEHIAEISVTQGALEVDGGSQMNSPETVVTTRQLPLGLLQKGEHYLYLNAADGPQAIWSLSVRALPVALTRLRWSEREIEPGEVSKLDYRSSGETDLTATINDSQGRVVRHLAQGGRILWGDRSLAWDGRRANGSAVADGRYRAVLRTSDPSGETGEVSSQIVVNMPPKIRFKKRPTKVVRTSKPRAKVKFVLKSNERAARYECRAKRKWMPCRARQKFRLSPGRYVFKARARDEFGAVDQKPLKWRFKVKRKR